MGTKLKIDVFGDCKIYLANTGTKDVPIDVISFYANEKPVSHTPSTGIIKKGAVQEINFTDLSPGRYKLLVKIYGNTMDFGWMTCTGCHWMKGECNTTDCPGAYNRTLICGPSGCSGDCDGHPPGTIRCKYDATCVGSLTASIENPPNGSHFFTGYPITFNGSASGGSKPYNYSWDLGETTMNGKSFTYAYTNASDYIVTLTVTDSASNTATDNVTIQINSPAVLFSCAIKTSCGGDETEVLGLSAQDNAHAEIIGGGGNYTYKLCCANVSSVQTTTGTGTCESVLGPSFTGLITLATNSTFDKNTNAQVERYNYTGTDGFDYKKNICVKLTSGSLKCNVISGSCPATAEIIFKVSDNTNAHIGDSTSSYQMRVCCCVS